MLLLVAGACALAALPNTTKCNYHGKTADWIHNDTLVDTAMVKQRVPATPPRIVLNLDLPPEQRWVEPLANLHNLTAEIKNYLDSLVPKWVVGLLEKVVGPLAEYRGFGEDYSKEIDGIAQTLDIGRGEIVLVNMMYVLENIGINCSNWNDTAPTGECKNKSDVLYPFRSKLGGGVTGPNGPCTSIVAQTPEGKVVHGRNFDWNIPEVLRQYMWEVEFQKGGKTIFTGTSIPTFIGVQNAMKKGSNGFAITMDARCQGGKLLVNLAEMLLKGGTTPSMLARRAMSTATDYDDFLDKLSNDPLIAPMYFIISGPQPGQGAVITRDREKAIDVWRVDAQDPNGWWRLQTNYDHWEPVPHADDRRNPGNAHMKALGQQNVTADTMHDILLMWPTFNPHTDHTAVFVVADGYYNTTVWMGN